MTIEPIDYALGELTGPELEEGKRLMREDSWFRAEVERLRPVVASLESLPDEAWQDLEPPPAPRVGAAEPAASHFWQRIPRFAPALAAAGAAVLVVVVLVAGGGDETVEAAPVALEPFDDGRTGSGEVLVDGDDVTVRVDGLPPSAEGEHYEAWLIGADGETVSVGTFSVGDARSGEVSAPLPEDPADYEFFDVSVEPDDGNEAHSGESVLRAPTTPS